MASSVPLWNVLVLFLWGPIIPLPLLSQLYNASKHSIYFWEIAGAHSDHYGRCSCCCCCCCGRSASNFKFDRPPVFCLCRCGCLHAASFYFSFPGTTGRQVWPDRGSRWIEFLFFALLQPTFGSWTNERIDRSACAPFSLSRRQIEIQAHGSLALLAFSSRVGCWTRLMIYFLLTFIRRPRVTQLWSLAQSWWIFLKFHLSNDEWLNPFNW